MTTLGQEMVLEEVVLEPQPAWYCLACSEMGHTAFCEFCGKQTINIPDAALNAYTELFLGHGLSTEGFDQAEKHFQYGADPINLLVNLGFLERVPNSNPAKLRFTTLKKLAKQFRSGMPAEVLGDLYHLAAALILRPSFSGYVFGAEAKVLAAVQFLALGGTDTYEGYAFEKTDHQVWREITGDTHDKARASNATKAVADTFLKDPDRCRYTLVERWIASISQEDATEIVQFLNLVFMKADLDPGPNVQKVILWSRFKDDDYRRMTPEAMSSISNALVKAGFVVILMGNAPLSFRANFKPPAQNCLDLFEHWNAGCFSGPNSYQKQLFMIYHLFARCGVIGQVGIKSGVMDGPALLGVPTLYIENKYEVSNEQRHKRMESWLQRVPNFERIRTERFVCPQQHLASVDLERSELDAIVDGVDHFASLEIKK